MLFKYPTCIQYNKYTHSKSQVPAREFPNIMDLKQKIHVRVTTFSCHDVDADDHDVGGDGSRLVVNS